VRINGNKDMLYYSKLMYVIMKEDILVRFHF